MKTLIIALSLISNMAFAGSKIVAQITNAAPGVALAQITEAGELKVIHRDRTESSLQLSETNKQSMMYAIQSLATAELQTDVRTIVCKMFVAPDSIPDMSVFDAESNSMKLVLSSGICALSTYTHPKEAYMMSIAQKLKAQILVLTNQLVK